MNLNKDKMASLKAFKSPIGKIHSYAAYLIMLHISAVIYSEVKEGNGLVSAMLSEKKILSEKTADE